VNYSDGTKTSFVQDLSDWFSPRNYPGEARVLSMPYRDTSNGLKDNRTFLLYGYSFGLNATKKVSSITLPNNRNVVVLAVSLAGQVSPQANPLAVDLRPR
jgi:alpha-mannosidase